VNTQHTQGGGPTWGTSWPVGTLCPLVGAVAVAVASAPAAAAAAAVVEWELPNHTPVHLATAHNK
jgi:hypothetical protein